MGTYINLSIVPSRISNFEWEQVYDESLKLVNAFPFADVVKREYFGYELLVYAKAVEKTNPERHWVIRGDLQSKRFAETFTLYRDISHYQSAKLKSSQKIFCLKRAGYRLMFLILKHRAMNTICTFWRL